MARDMVQPPGDPTIWIRCEAPAQLPAIADIRERLNQDGDAVRFVVTQRNHPSDPHPKGGRAIRAFLALHRPIMVILLGGTIDTAILAACDASGTPVVTIDARPDTLREMTGGWFRASPKPVLSDITAAFAADARNADTLGKLGIPPDRLFHIGPLERSARLLPYSETERAELSSELRNRPVWAARAATPADAELLAVSHRHAARRLHRLLLIVIPQSPVYGADLAEAFRDVGYHVGLRSAGDTADETVQVFVADLDGEDGLWLRLAPICYAAGTLDRGAAHDPFEAAALGSVVVHGMKTDPYEDRFRRLLRAGASLGMSDETKLGATVEQLCSVDRAAEMAVAGWEVTSSGAEISNRLITLIQDRLDGLGG